VVERQRFLEHCAEQRFGKRGLERIAGILLTAATDLQAHGGLDIGHAGLESAVTRIEKVRTGAGFGRGAREYRRGFLLITARWLRFIGRLQGPAARPRPYAALLDDFARWMTEERGLSAITVKSRRWHLGQFLDWLHERGRRVPDLTLRDLDAYLQHLHAKGLSRVAIKNYINAVRAFIRHAEQRGWCTAGLADALHGPHIYREHGCRSACLGRTSASRDDAASDTAMDVRDRAILLLFAVYGLRAGEVANLRLEDIDWDHDRLTVRRPKQRRSQAYPLAPAVGQAIIRYLKEARPRCAFRELFIRTIAPIGPMTSGGLYSVVGERIKRLGIQAPHRGPHVLRHACAGHLLARGLSLKEIGDHLGHRSLESTRIYAKVDIQGLREVAAFDLGGLA
jgi:site-specific recombinase XerD